MMNNEKSSNGKVKVRVRVQRRKYDNNGQEIPHNHSHTHTTESNNTINLNQPTNSMVTETLSLVPATTNDLTTMKIDEKQYKPSNVRITRRRKKVNTVSDRKPFKEVYEDRNFTEINEDTYEPEHVKLNSRFLGKGPFDSTTVSNSEIDTGLSSDDLPIETQVDETAEPRTDQSFTSFVGPELAKDPRAEDEEESSDDDVKPYNPGRYVHYDTFGANEQEDMSYLYPKEEAKPGKSSNWLKTKKPSKLDEVYVKNDLEVIEFEPFFQKEKKFSRKTFRFDDRKEIKESDSDLESLSSIANTYNDEVEENSPQEPQRKIIQSIEEDDQLIEIYQTGSSTIDESDSPNKLQGDNYNSVIEKQEKSSEIIEAGSHGKDNNAQASVSSRNLTSVEKQSEIDQKEVSQSNTASTISSPTFKSASSRQSIYSPNSSGLSTPSTRKATFRTSKQNIDIEEPVPKSSSKYGDRESYTGSLRPLPPTDPNNPNYYSSDVDILPIIEEDNNSTATSKSISTAGTASTIDLVTVSELQTASTRSAEYVEFSGPSGAQSGVDYYVELSRTESENTHSTSQSGVELAEDDNSSMFSHLKQINDASERDDF